MFCGKRRIIKSLCSCIPLFTGLSLGIWMDSGVIQSVSNSVNAGSICLTKRKWQQLNFILQALISGWTCFTLILCFCILKVTISIFFLLWSFIVFIDFALTLNISFQKIKFYYCYFLKPDFTLKWMKWYKHLIKQNVILIPQLLHCLYM